MRSVDVDASPETRADINHLLRYPEDSAGSIMTVEYVDLREDMTVTDAIDRIRKKGVDSETINICYVVSRQKILVGTVALRYLLITNPDEIIGDIMNTNKSVKGIKPVFLSSSNISYRMATYADSKYRYEFPRLNNGKDVSISEKETGYVLKRKK